MGYFQWIGEKIKRLTVWDVAILKTCVFAFALMLAKLWPTILGARWQWYGGVFLITYAYLIYKIYIKK